MSESKAYFPIGTARSSFICPRRFIDLPQSYQFVTYINISQMGEFSGRS
jgi:hypothetical protein